MRVSEKSGVSGGASKTIDAAGVLDGATARDEARRTKPTFMSTMFELNCLLAGFSNALQKAGASPHDRRHK